MKITGVYYDCFRFLGTTPKSSSIRRMLKTVMWQIKYVYKLTSKVPRVSIVFFFFEIVNSI